MKETSDQPLIEPRQNPNISDEKFFITGEGGKEEQRTLNLEDISKLKGIDSSLLQGLGISIPQGNGKCKYCAHCDV